MTNSSSEQVRALVGKTPGRAFPCFRQLTALCEQEIFLLEGPPAWSAAAKSPVYTLPGWVRSDRTAYLPEVPGLMLIMGGGAW